jgi:dienelactone hydrolase
MAGFGAELRIAGIPLLAVADCQPEEAATRGGCIIVVHGLGGDKRVQIPELERLARAGFLALGIDAAGHGTRRWDDFDELFRANDAVAARAFQVVVSETTADVTTLVTAALERGWAVPGQVGLAGVSLGGYVAYGAAVTERRLGAVVAILGSPDWGAGMPESPHLVPERFFPLPLLSAVAKRDEVVPPAASRALHAALAPHYAPAPERLRLVERAGSGHAMTPEDWEATWWDAVGWFTSYLHPR